MRRPAVLVCCAAGQRKPGGLGSLLRWLVRVPSGVPFHDAGHLGSCCRLRQSIQPLPVFSEEARRMERQGSQCFSMHCLVPPSLG